MTTPAPSHKLILAPQRIAELLTASGQAQGSGPAPHTEDLARLLERAILAELWVTPPPPQGRARDVHAICVALSDRIKAIAAKPCVGPDDLQRLADIALGVRLAADPRLADATEPEGELEAPGAGRRPCDVDPVRHDLYTETDAGTGLSLTDCISRFRAHAQSHPSRDVALGMTFCADFLRDYGPPPAASAGEVPGAAPARAGSSLGTRVAAARATMAGWPQEELRDSVRLEGGGDRPASRPANRPAASAGWCTTLEQAGKDGQDGQDGQNRPPNPGDVDAGQAVAAQAGKPCGAGVVAYALPSIDTHAFRALVEQVGYHNLQHVSYSELVTYVNDHVRRVFLAARPSDDALWDQTMGERDTYHDWADKLAAAIAICFGADIGEHSNQNCPWHEALVAIETATEARRLAALMPAVAGAVRALPITLGQAEKLVAFFGGHDAEVTVSERPHDWAGPDGLYAWCSEYPAEGTVFLGATEVDDERARLGSRGAGAAGSAAVAAAEPAPAGAVEPGGASPGANAS